MTKIKAFTLIEIIIVLSIIAILSGLVYPSYLSYITRTRRADGQTALLELANQMESYYQTSHTYATATIGTGNHTDIREKSTTSEGWYRLSITHQNKFHYTLQATAQFSQAENDLHCKNLSLNDLGEKKPSFMHEHQNEKCW